MMLRLRFQALCLRSRCHKFNSVLAAQLCPFPSNSLTCCHFAAYSSTPILLQKNLVVFEYLVETLNFSKTNALAISERFPCMNATSKLYKTVSLLRRFGFSDSQIVSSILSLPRILSVSIEKNLKPKLMFFQELGLSGSNLGDFISKRSSLLDHSLEKKFKPCVMLIKEVLVNGGRCKINSNNNKDLLFVLSRCSWLIPSVSRLSSNFSYLKSIGISPSDLSNLLKRQPRVFILNEAQLRNNISEVIEMGFVIGSQMFLHALRARCSVSDDSLNKKFELFQNFGISRNEVLGMFRKAPNIMKLSESNIRSEIEFLLQFLDLDKSVIINRPVLLLLSMENRVMPRYRVFEVIKSKGLLEKEPKFIRLLQLSEEKFVEKYISRFGNELEELWMAYKGPHLDFPREKE